MTHHEYATIKSENLKDILSAFIASLKEGKDGLMIIPANPRIEQSLIFDVPDNNEIVALQGLVREYEQLIAEGNTLTRKGDRREAYEFAKSLLEITQWAKPKTAPDVIKNRKDVENELLRFCFKTWREILEESSDGDAEYFKLVMPNDADKMKTVYHNSVKEGLIDDSITEEGFLYYFGGFSSEAPEDKIIWLGTVVDLTSYVKAFTEDAFVWNKTAKIFYVRSRQGVIKEVTEKTLKQSYCRDGTTDYDKSDGRIEGFRTRLLLQEGE